jgi:hypothetical protein
VTVTIESLGLANFLESYYRLSQPARDSLLVQCAELHAKEVFTGEPVVIASARLAAHEPEMKA